MVRMEVVSVTVAGCKCTYYLSALDVFSSAWKSNAGIGGPGRGGCVSCLYLSQIHVKSAQCS